MPAKSCAESPNHELRVRDVFLRLDGTDLKPFTAAGKALSDDPIELIPGDCVQIEAATVDSFDPTAPLELARWKFVWSHHSGGFLGIGGTDHHDTVWAPIRKKVGGDGLIVKIAVPGAGAEAELKPVTGRQPGVLALKVGPLAISGVTGNLTPPGDFGKTDKDAKRDEMSEQGKVNGKNVFHLLVHVTRPTIKDGTDQ